jgi:hypothetical protein
VLFVKGSYCSDNRSEDLEEEDLSVGHLKPGAVTKVRYQLGIVRTYETRQLTGGIAVPASIQIDVLCPMASGRQHPTTRCLSGRHHVLLLKGSVL